MATLQQTMALPLIPSSNNSSSTAMSFINRAKSSGRCTPSLLPNDSELNADASFLAFISKLIDDSGSHGPMLKNETLTGQEFLKALEMVRNVNSINSNIDKDTKVNILKYRRAMLLLFVGCTASNNEALNYILKSGFLLHVKSWLDDILTSKVGGVDLLLHLLSSISMLPVSKDMVTSSKLGKQVAAVEKHKICTGGMNQKAIKDRVSKVKEEWSASVKRLKKMNTTKNDKLNLKRSLEVENAASQVSSKRVKTGVTLPNPSLSDLLKQVSGAKSNDKTKNSFNKDTDKVSTMNYTTKVDNSANLVETRPEPVKTVFEDDNTNHKRKISVKNQNRRIRWADHEGGPLSVTHFQQHKEAGDTFADGGESWKDRKKRDRLRERELIQKARSSKLVDKDDSLDTMAMIFSSKWHQPSLLPPDAENLPVQVDSKEVIVQTKRMASVMPVNYLSEDDVPRNPYPLTETEQTTDMNNQSISVPQIIPFFIPQVPTAAPTPLPVPPPTTLPPSIPPPLPAPTMLPPAIGATIDVVRSMGLPEFLVGQNTQALQALVASPGLLNTFVDVNGKYDQVRIMNLIQAMNQQLQKPSGTVIPSVPPPPIPPTPAIPPPIQPNFGHYGPSQYKPPPQAPTYKPPTKPPSNGYRGDQNNTDGNLHLSGYGPTTSIESIISLFAPYVKVDEVVPKSGFMFLNTSDPEGAKRAREALNGVMIGGTPLRINVALRRNKNTTMGSTTSTSTSGAPTTTFLPRNALGQVDFEAVRDDRGNPATKNLFVAGYGQGTTEQQLRDVFSQHTQVTGVVMKGSFSFVNTLEKNSAVLARQALVGTIVNGSPLRINFAKESGRLGTSFDSGYNGTKRNPAFLSHYGHSY